VRFGNLGLVVVDEQHKFGVSQRATLRGKKAPGGRMSLPHYLVMTATPIPRTLSMTVFGDLDVSVIDKLPPGRQPIRTRIVRAIDEQAAWLEVRRCLAAGDQAYIVYPLIEESDALEVKAATVEVERVRNELLPGARVGLLHGRMTNGEKQAVMADFNAGRLDALVSTTVIEVGVDVPNATVMVVEHAERYGLAALHQLRGRVGRGTKPSVCLLFTDSESDLANRRLGVLCETTDGFKIAEEDLRIRGPGELLGTRQHGWPEFRVANLVEDTDLLLQARDDAARLVREDPALEHPEHATLRAELRRRFRDKVAFIDVG
jgi:ATP-dependent DNA helicase RecG